MGADLGAFADQRHIAVAQPKAPVARQGRRMGQKDLAGRPLPLRVAGREMPPDVALRQRAIDRVGQRVHAHIGVGMAQKAPVMRQLDPA